MRTTNNEHKAYDTRGFVLAVKWHNGEKATPGRREGQDNEPGREGGGEGELRYRSINKRDN
jgi:hypothetical protein